MSDDIIQQAAKDRRDLLATAQVHATLAVADAIKGGSRAHIEAEGDTVGIDLYEAQTAALREAEATLEARRADDALVLDMWREHLRTLSEAEAEVERLEAEVERLTRERDNAVDQRNSLSHTVADLHDDLHDREMGADADGNALVTVRADDLRRVLATRPLDDSSGEFRLTRALEEREARA